MAKLAIKKASTDVTVYVFIQDSSVTTGAGLTGLAYDTANLICYYVRPLGSATQLTLATQTVTGAHSDGGFKEIDSTNMPGVYRLDLSDAICATGVNSVVVMLSGAANMSPCIIELQLTDFDLNSSSNTVGAVTLDTAQPAITWAQQKIVANVAGQGALDIYNSNANGIGQFNHAAAYGMYNECGGAGNAGQYNSGGDYGSLNEGSVAGQQNAGTSYGQYNSGTNDVGQFNVGDSAGQENNGVVGQQNTGVTKDVDGYDPDILDETIDGIYTIDDILKLSAAVLAGKVSGGGTNTIVYRDLSDTLDRITATVDTDGNRLAIIRNV